VRTVALVGFADNTRSFAYHLPANVELWTLNRGWSFAEHFTRIDRLFELHDLPYLSDPNNADTRQSLSDAKQSHWDWLQGPHDYPLYCLDAYREIPGSVSYPLQAVMEDAFRHIWRGNENVRLAASTFDFMLALAIHERVDRVEIYGFEMGTGTEFQYQHATAMLLIGLAGGRGIDVWTPETSGLIPRMKLYGYEGAQMITRQTLEAYKRQADTERDRYKALTNARLGILQHLMHVNTNESLAQKEQMEDVQNDYLEALQAAARWDGVQQVLNLLVAECDMLEVNPEMIKAGMTIQPAFERMGDDGRHT